MSADLFRRVVDVDHVHLRARHHDVAHLHVGDTAARPRSWTARRRRSGCARRRHAAESSSCSRSSGSRSSSVARRSSRFGSTGMGPCSKVRVGITEGSKDFAFTRFHPCGVAGAGLVVIALQMQHTMHDQVREVGVAVLLCSAASRSTTGRHSTRSPSSSALGGIWKGQHVGGVVLAAIVAVERRPSSTSTRRTVTSGSARCSLRVPSGAPAARVGAPTFPAGYWHAATPSGLRPAYSVLAACFS